jgi:NAD(P)-dependent dehydrogenase (short-subunit alcohol dehydrogenase family)
LLSGGGQPAQFCEPANYNVKYVGGFNMSAGSARLSGRGYRHSCRYVLVPGFMQTPLNQRLSSDPNSVTALAVSTVMGRKGEPEDFAGAAAFLASSVLANVIGELPTVDGGFCIH